MANTFRFELNHSGVGQLLKSSDMAKALETYAKQMQSKCGSGYETDTYQAGTRVIASVATTDYESMKDNSENNTLLKALK